MNDSEAKTLSTAAWIRARLTGARGPEYWRRLEELSDSEEFRARLGSELPSSSPIDRREFVTMIGAGLALAGLGGCGKPPVEKIIPQARQPIDSAPGRSLEYATVLPAPGGAIGVLVRCDSGRPTKIEGNPQHPASLGATDAITQAQIYSLWDPERSQTLLENGAPSTWPAFLRALATGLAQAKSRKGEGLRILSDELLSPTLAGQRDELLRRYPEARWHVHSPCSRQREARGLRGAFGRDVQPLFRLGKADRILSLDADFLLNGPGSVRLAHDFVDRRRRQGRSEDRCRLYCAETMPSVTGITADHRWPLKPSEIEGAARALARRLQDPNAGAPEFLPWLGPVARDLRSRAPRSLVVAGREQPPAVHALAARMNQSLGAVGGVLEYIEPPIVDGDASLTELAADMAAGKVRALILLGGNPAYAAPAAAGFEAALARVPLRVHVGLSVNESSKACGWFVPETHPLESWGDAAAFDGTLSIQQPAIAPLYEARSVHEVVAALMGDAGRSAYELVRSYWRNRSGAADFDIRWRQWLHEGVIPNTAHAPVRVALQKEAPDAEPPRGAGPVGLELSFRPDPTIGDGRHAANPWLQELPKPMTQLTWDNALMISPREAERRGLANGDIVTLIAASRKTTAPVWIVPGHADGAVTAHLGYGRASAGPVGTGRGFNAFPLRTEDGAAVGAVLEKAGGTVPLASTQQHHSMEGRDLARLVTVRDIPAAAPAEPKLPSIYPAPEYPGGYAWGMVIDLDACISCHACMTACQVENNIPSVGKQEVLRSRELFWIRVDSYHAGDRDNPVRIPQPVPCMHCEHAPCEVVCPTFATSHSGEGLNQMVYNRCIGTRYCQNNCPYFVRRFNFFQYADYATPSLQLMYNPQVTVRERGVMEKCTYCVQRISRARITAEKEDRRIAEGEVRTACQQVCPTGAILFGDLRNPESEVSRLRRNPLHYELLGELGTRPRTTYLARIRNPNPEIEGS